MTSSASAMVNPGRDTFCVFAVLRNSLKTSSPARGKHKKTANLFLSWLVFLMVHPKETAGYQTFPERERFTARRNLSGIFRSRTSPITTNISKWYSVVLRYNLCSKIMLKSYTPRYILLKIQILGDL